MLSLDMPQEQEWYAKWVEQKDMQPHMEIAVQVFLQLEHEPVRRVVEYFGGMGNQTRMLQKLFRPELHIVFDNHPDACAHLRSLGLPIDVRQEEFALAGEHDFQPDLAVLDFPNLGWVGAQTKYHAPLANVFTRGTPHVVLTDTAGIRFPTQRRPDKRGHGGAYARMLGIENPTFDDYLRGFSRWLFSEWGYSMRVAFHCGFRGSLKPDECMFLLQPGPGEPVIVPYREER